MSKTEMEGQDEPHHVLLVPVDDSDTSERVLDYLLREFCRPDDQIHLLHIIPTPMPGWVGGGIGAMFVAEEDPAADAQHIREAKAFMTRRLLPLLEVHRARYKAEILHFLTDEDSIGQAICKRADQLRPRVVIMAKHERGRIKEFFLGSAAKHVVTKCKWPVLILHEEALGGKTSNQAARSSAHED